MAFNELALAAIGDDSHLEGTAAARGGFLCMLHRNEPGWFVGEHMHVRDGWDFIVLEPHFVEAMEENMSDMILFLRAKKANGRLQFESGCCYNR